MAFGRFYFLLIFVFCAALAYGQDEEKKEKKITFDGYVKNLITVSPIRGFDSAWVENQIHNRVNLKWYPNAKINVYLEVRNRMFWGDFAKNIPSYGQLVDLNNDFVDLSLTVVDRRSWVVQTMIDRAYLEWHKDNWEIRVGRQRINWGVALVWNPNDLFNAFSFFDFDYEERPGSDGIRIKKYTGFASSVEVASNFAEDLDELTTAGVWRFNKWEYDFQVLAGKALEDLALGIGWAGNLGDAGLKGEISLLHPYKSNGNETVLLASLSSDYSFESSLYLHGALFLNTAGSSNPTDPLLDNRLSRINVRSLSPYKVSTLLQTSYTIHPLVNTGVALIFYPSNQALFINPTLAISIMKNWDMDLISQIYFQEENGSYRAIGKFLFLRTKWSF